MQKQDQDFESLHNVMEQVSSLASNMAAIGDKSQRSAKLSRPLV